MIELSYNQIILIPLTLCLLWLGWSSYWAMRRERPRVVKISPQIFRCTDCSKVYLTQKRYPMSSCPNCGLMNEAIQR